MCARDSTKIIIEHVGAGLLPATVKPSPRDSISSSKRDETASRGFGETIDLRCLRIIHMIDMVDTVDTVDLGSWIDSMRNIVLAWFYLD